MPEYRQYAIGLCGVRRHLFHGQQRRLVFLRADWPSGRSALPWRWRTFPGHDDADAAAPCAFPRAHWPSGRSALPPRLGHVFPRTQRRRRGLPPYRMLVHISPAPWPSGRSALPRPFGGAFLLALLAPQSLLEYLGARGSSPSPAHCLKQFAERTKESAPGALDPDGQHQ